MNKKAANIWNAGHYDEKIRYVSRLGQSLIGMLQPAAGERILDIGCGTGDLAWEIAKSGAHVTGIDSSEAMIAQAAAKYPALQFRCDDAQTFRLQAGEAPYDALFSNAALHWIRRPAEAAEAMALALRPGGRLVVEFGGCGNIAAIYRGIRTALAAAGIDAEERNPWYFPGIGEYASLLEAQGLNVRTAELYDRPTPLGDGERGLRNWLDAFAGMFFSGLSEPQKEAAYARCEEAVREELYRGGEYIADYRRLRITAVKR
ncbi:type 12 methyltransferase [Paenibacillus mucilaginosus 3016]|uniref:Type 12 methyltransferase n=2 Tax=Paenibacillus mucilaginosus TaxID=61624 RepID=H6NDY3_9BACL|nr:class I SAM-dependent methyltransferase [Paenibacillus mucilaginosus]AFC32936.1 type 12 methyltransferase [Paenibacillus mucilaginosus 3016]AFH65247.1 methyltransferase type 11 [Paenibacillus mucilaginosus K02]WFA21385.1 class I SAM-dependent methyltransferase [Paenibacillus mucilaginosus]